MGASPAVPIRVHDRGPSALPSYPGQFPAHLALCFYHPKSSRRATICKVDKRVQGMGLPNGQCANALGWRAVAVRNAIPQILLAHLLRPTTTDDRRSDTWPQVA